MSLQAGPTRRYARLLGASSVAAAVAVAGVTYAVGGAVLLAEPGVAAWWRAVGVLSFAAAFVLVRFSWHRAVELLRGRLDLALPPSIVVLSVVLLCVTFPWSLVVVVLYLPMLVAGVALLLLAVAAAARVGMQTTRWALLAAGALSVAAGAVYDRSYSGLVCDDAACVVSDRRALIAGALIGLSFCATAWLLPTCARAVKPAADA